MAASAAAPRARVDYFYDEAVGNFVYSATHPMRPHRVRLTHHLCVSFGLHQHMNIFRPKRAAAGDMTSFHSDDYVEFLQQVSPDNMGAKVDAFERFGVNEDCPIFDGLWEYCQTYTGGSLGGASRLAAGSTDIVLNWAGGLHHAKKTEASGFCYINDIVLAILELLKVHARVLYIDIDIHHGDGVEEAFYTTDRVMTLSFHQAQGYFPQTGAVNDLGAKRGRHHAINMPLNAGMDDAAYESLFKPVVDRAVQVFRPSVVVLCCGADSLSGDRLGCWNLSIRGHGAVLDHVKSFNLPMLVLGGGGYTIRNVARCWAYETSRLCGVPVADAIPYHEYQEYYGPNYALHFPVSNMQNTNDKRYLDRVRSAVLEALSSIPVAPSVALQTGQPGTRSAPAPLCGADDWSDEDEVDSRPLSSRRRHLAEFLDQPDADSDTMDTTKLGLCDFADCGCHFGCSECDEE